MKPKLNKLITLLLILGTFTFMMEAQERVSTVAQKELSRWASSLPVKVEYLTADSTGNLPLDTPIVLSFHSKTKEKVISVNN